MDALSPKELAAEAFGRFEQEFDELEGVERQYKMHDMNEAARAMEVTEETE